MVPPERVSAQSENGQTSDNFGQNRSDFGQFRTIRPRLSASEGFVQFSKDPLD